LTGDNEIVVNNLLIHNANAGVQIAGYTGVDNLHIYNNTIANNGSRGIVFWPATEDGGTSINNAQVYNNIISGNGAQDNAAGIEGCGPVGTGNLISNNLFFANANGDIDWSACGSYDPSKFQITVANSIDKDPLFASTSDFHLKSGSPAFGAGLSLPQVSVDFSGDPRAAPWTIGAYQ
jgi:hypothetical protein